MVMQRKGPPTDELAAEYESGATSVELAGKYGMTHAAVVRRLRRAGTPIRPARRRTIYDDVAITSAIVEAYESGQPMAEIADRMMIGRGTVQRAIAASGTKARPHGLRRQSVSVPVDRADLGWLAGMFDGEGNLQLRKPDADGSMACKLAIYSTTPEVMDWLSEKVGGTVRWDHKRTELRGWKPIGIWEVYRAQDVAVLLRAMLPHLVIKRPRAIEVLAHFENRFHIHDSPPQITQ
jgi:hypothetical protein